MDEPPRLPPTPPVVQATGLKPEDASGACGKPQSPKTWDRFLGSKLAVLAAIFFAMMFLGLPLLWKSPRFSNAERIVWSVLTIVYSILVFWLFYLVMAWSYSRIFPT